MRYPEFHYRWEWLLQASPDALWPLVSDTNRFNRDTGVPAVEHPPGDTTRLANARQRLRLYRFGIPVEWEEEPFEWIRPSRFGVERRYTKGPVAEMRVLVELTPQRSGGTHLVYQVWARPRNALGLVAVRADPEVAELLAQPGSGVGAEQLHATLKGLDDERFDLWRVVPMVPAAHHAA